MRTIRSPCVKLEKTHGTLEASGESAEQQQTGQPGEGAGPWTEVAPFKELLAFQELSGHGRARWWSLFSSSSCFTSAVCAEGSVFHTDGRSQTVPCRLAAAVLDATRGLSFSG